MRKLYIFIFFVLISFAMGIFYWLAIRPSNVVKKCHEQSLQESVWTYSYTSYPDLEERDKLQSQAYKDYYNSCLKKNGLNP